VRFPRATRQVVLKIGGAKHWLWRAVDQTGVVLDVLVQRRRDKQAAKRLLRKLLEADASATRHDHRQARQLRRGKEGGHTRD
jgi:transposase-like protein